MTEDTPLQISIIINQLLYANFPSHHSVICNLYLWQIVSKISYGKNCSYIQFKAIYLSCVLLYIEYYFCLYYLYKFFYSTFSSNSLPVLLLT